MTTPPINIASTLIDKINATPPVNYYFHNVRSPARVWVDKFLTEGIRLSKSEPFSILPPHDWGAEDPKDREWLVLRNAFFHVDWIFQAFLESKEPRYLRLAATNLVDWYSFNIHHNHPNRAKWSDICTGLRSFYYAFAIDRCARDPSCHLFLPILIDAAVAHGEELMRPESLAKSNHAIFQGLGLAAAGAVLTGHPANNGWLERGSKILDDILTSQYGHEGIHLEHSPYYHGWVLQRLKRISDVGFFDEESAFYRLVKLCSHNFVHFFRPDGTLSEIGDSSPEKISWVASMDPALLYASSGGKNGKSPIQTDHLFREAGYAILRDSFENGLGRSHLVCHAGHHMPSHKHDDDFTVEWSEFGKRILVDAGKLSYDYNERRDYVLSRRAHNVLQIDDGSGFNVRAPYGAAEMIGGEAAGVKFVKLTLPGDRLGCKQSRVVFLMHGSFLLVVDIIEAGEQHDYTQWFHFPPGAEAATIGRGANVSIPSETPIKVSMSPLYDATSSEVFVGQEAPLQGWFSPDYAHLVPAPAVGIQSAGRSAVLATLLEVGLVHNTILSEGARITGNQLEIAFRWSAYHPLTRIQLDGQTVKIDGPSSRKEHASNV